MRALHSMHPFLAPAEDGGAAGGADSAAPAAPASAAAAHVPASGEIPDGGNETAQNDPAPATPAEPASAAAAHAPAPGESPDGGSPGGDGKPAEPRKPDRGDADLSSMSDEDYAKAVVPDVEGGEADRSLIGAMSQGLRELGVQPGLMQRIAALYTEKVRDALARDDAERAAAMEELNARCEAEITDQQWADFGAAYAECIAGDGELKHLVDHTELGSSPAFIRLCALAGATLRVERTPAATASAGSGQADLNRKLFEATVPPNLR